MKGSQFSCWMSVKASYDTKALSNERIRFVVKIKT